MKQSPAPADSKDDKASKDKKADTKVVAHKAAPQQSALANTGASAGLVGLFAAVASAAGIGINVARRRA